MAGIWSKSGKGFKGCRTPEMTHKGGATQLVPEETEWPQCSDIFLNPGSDVDIVEYPRYLQEPEVYCPHEHKVYLSRLPWQSSCKACQHLRGWPRFMLRDYYRKILGSWVMLILFLFSMFLFFLVWGFTCNFFHALQPNLRYEPSALVCLSQA